MALPNKTVQERVGILEHSHEDCRNMQVERYEGMMKRIERVENKLTGALGVGIVIILTMLANIAVALFKK